ncbi:MAG: ABC transporter ATP-binding protein [Nitrospina sp.]|jgi:ATP-binding cassette, subfamily B, bacterial MsbA|nr:ABC transporter ATP-binding protein [Nitrospina sp.]MBT5632648.1 ABC transporter ATP-binding protein [Nitrospina sp.]
MKEFRKILKYAKPYTKSLIFAFLCLALTSLINLVLPLIVRNMINAVIVLKNNEVLDSLAWDLIIIIGLQAAFAVTHNYIFGFVGHRMTTDFRIEFFSHIQSLSLRFFQERRVGELLSRMNNDISVIQNALVTIPVALLRQSITLLGAMAIILYLNWKLTGLILLILPPLMIFARVFGRRLKTISEKLQDHVAQAVVVLEEVMSSIKIVKSFTREPYEQNRFQEKIETAFERAVDKIKISSFFGPFILGLTFLVSALLIWYGGYQVMQGTTTPGELAAFFLYSLIIAGPIGTFVRLYTQIQEARGAIQRVYEILDTEPMIQNPDNPVSIENITGSIQFENVIFGYQDSAQVIHNASFKVLPGQTVALVGPSGAGKSTIIKLLLRFFDPDSGVISLDGYDIRSLDRKSFLSQIALVPQETLLFGGTVRENILYGKLDATDLELKEAAQNANAHEFIMAMEKGYDTIVGEKGTKLSGGERQRIAIARAILKDPKILILDEATSSLDNRSESLIQEALETLMTHRTTFIVAHRLSTIHKADQIIVLDKGCIVETGQHEDLMNQKGLYHTLYTMKMLDPTTHEGSGL